MADNLTIVPVPGHDARANLEGFVAICRQKLTVFGAELPFESDVWDVTDSVALRAKAGCNIRITFSNVSERGDRKTVVMREPFRSFAKAYTRYMQGMRPTKVINNRLAALRALESALIERGGTPDPTRVDSAVLNRAAQIVRDRYGSGAAYRVGGQLEMLASFMADACITAGPIRWRNPIRRPSSSVKVGKEFDALRAQKMPSKAALDALPQIFRLAKAPADVMTASVAAILLSAPDRIGEVLTLPDACEVREPRTGKPDACGLRWWPAKGAEPMVKWLVPSMSTVVADALARIRSITNEARRIAKWYEDHPREVYLTEDARYLRNREWLSTDEVALVVGLGSVGNANAWCKGQKIAMVRSGGPRRAVRVLFADVERAVVALLPRGFPFVDISTGLKYSQALFVVRRNELGAQRATYHCMIEPVSINQINTGLGSRTRHGFDSIFSRLGFREPDGRPIEVTSHQFRHYLNTLALSGGLSQLDVAKWSGRTDIHQNDVYDHVTPSEMLQKIRDTIGDDEMFGPLARLRTKVPITRDEFARLVVPTAHVTDIGYCVRDFAQLLCDKYLDCINCQSFVCIKGDVRHSARVHARLAEAEKLLGTATAAAGEGCIGSNRWLDHHRVRVERLTRLCDILDDPAVPDGAVIRLAPPEQPSTLDTTGGDNLVGGSVTLTDTAATQALPGKTSR